MGLSNSVQPSWMIVRSAETVLLYVKLLGCLRKKTYICLDYGRLSFRMAHIPDFEHA
jgi:hypothetical protein